MRAIILAAGEGSRMGKLTQNIPKPLLDINGKSIIERQLSSLKQNGVLDIIIVTGTHHEKFNFKNTNTPCLKCFYQTDPSDDILNCEAEGILGPVASIIGNIQANEVLKKILKIGKDLNKFILIINLLNLDFRKVSFTKKNNCICGKL